MHPSRSRGLLSRALVVLLVLAIAVVGLPAGSGGGGGGFGRVRQWLEALLAPDPASAAVQVDQAGPAKAAEPPRRVRELGEQRSATTRVFAFSDGTFEAEVSPEPESFKDGGGVWRDIDTTVRERGRDGYRFLNDSNGFRSYFGDKSDRLVRVEAGGEHVALGLEGAARSVSPRMEGETVTYAGVFEGTDVAYEVTGDSLKERIVLARPPADFGVAVHGAGGRRAGPRLPDGSIGFFAEGPAGDGPPLFVMPKPFMNDSRVDPKSPHGTTFSDQVTQTVEQRGATTTITVKADAGWLSAPERQYPVVIDPTIKVEPTPTTGQDTQIWSDTPARNDGSDYRLSVGSDAWGVARSLLRFDTSVVPAGTSLTSAKLRLYFDSEIPSTQVDNTIEVRRVTQSWSEDTGPGTRSTPRSPRPDCRPRSSR